jgi:putative protease
MIDAGVRVLKIEGRARSAEYVREVSKCYDEAVRAIEDGTFDQAKTALWRERLATVFNRGFWDGYYLGQRLGEWNTNYGSSATKRKIYLGKVTNYFKNLNVAEIKVENGNLNSVSCICLLSIDTNGDRYGTPKISILDR